MANDPTPAPIQDSPAAYGWCAWHQAYARGVRLVRIFEQGSGPGTNGNLFACPPCRGAYDLIPLADQP